MLKKILSIALFSVLVLCLAGSAFAIEFKDYGYPILMQYDVNYDGWGRETCFVTNCKEWISVWAEPRFGSERLGILLKGTRINYSQPYNDQFIIYEIGDGRIGYVNTEYLSSDFDDAMSLYIDNCNEWVSLWSEPRVGAERICKLVKELKIQYWSPYNEEYISCDVGGDGGYVRWEYLSTKKP